jgi:DNA modification methylase
MTGYMGMTDFRGEVIRAFQDAGWIFDGEVTVWKDPQAQSIRTRSHALAFATKNRDSATTRPALADYLLLFKKQGDNAVQIKNDVSNDEWIEWASPIWTDHHEGGWLTEDGNICPVWYGIRETDTLNTRVAKESADERHICPLQLPFIDRCVRLWSNPGELVLTPFAGIGSELYQSLKLGRKAIGIELKPSYWATAVENLRALEAELEAPTLFDDSSVMRNGE